MPTPARLLTTEWFLQHYAGELAKVADPAILVPVTVPPPGERFNDDTLAALRVGFFHGDFRSDPEFTRRFFGACLRAPNLAWMQLPNSGVDDPVFARLRERGVRLTNAPSAAAEPIALNAITGLLMLARGFPHWMQAQRDRRWTPHPWSDAPPDLAGQRMILVGLGAIGSRIAALAAALGIEVIGVRRSDADPPNGVTRICHPRDLRTQLEHADWLVLACPLTPETRGLIDAAALAAIKPGARIVNISRGEVIDEAALIAAIESKHIAGAYLDVFGIEPLPSDSPLWGLSNVILTPHDAASSQGNAHRVSRLFLRNIEAWLRDGPLTHELP